MKILRKRVARGSMLPRERSKDALSCVSNLQQKVSGVPLDALSICAIHLRVGEMLGKNLAETFGCMYCKVLYRTTAP